MRRQQQTENTVLFSSEIINECCKKLMFNFNKDARTALAFLSIGHLGKAADYFKKRNSKLMGLLEAHLDAASAYKKMLRQEKTWLNDDKYGVYLPIVAHLLFEDEVFHENIAKINAKNVSKKCLAYYNYAIADAYLFEGDMLSASQKSSAALDYFRKKKYAFESVMCYLQLGQIYRLSCVNDVAQTMIEAAVKINQEQKTPRFLAKSIAALGMLMLFENRLEEAEDKFNQALELPAGLNLSADIYNQKSLLAIAENQTDKAEKYAAKALKTFKSLQNKHGEAYSTQLLAQIFYSRKEYKKVLKYGDKAAKIYQSKRNYSAYIECIYLMADAYFAENHLEKAENLLRQILDEDKKHRHNFHISNAYSLLGLIYLHKKDLQRAKVLLQQSLHLEQRNQRCEGLVADYANLALIDHMAGRISEAESNIELAMQYAKETDNQELMDLIKKKYDDFT